jgi:aspartyl-tRNA(Asn)/glutamyl-tRNA(Gln) amidotransferase subunit C
MSNKVDVDHLAKLAKLEVSQEEKAKLADQLGATVDYIEVLEELDTEKVKPSSQVTGQSNVFRKDKSEECLNQEEALANAPKTSNGYFVVPKIKWENQ